jgi:chromosome segregation ATPase
VEKQETFNTQQQEMHSDIVEKDKHLENLQEEQELLREALEVSESRWEEAQDEYAREKANLERLATERALEELEEEREVFTEERERLQEERLRVSRRVEELEGKQEAVEQQCTELQEILRVERLHHTEKLEQERRAGELEKRIAKAEKAKMATKNKGVKLKLKRHFDLLQAELRQTKKRLEELGSEQKVSVPEWPFSDDDFL